MAVVSRRRVFAGAVISLVLLAFFWYRDVVTATDKVRHHEEQLGRAWRGTPGLIDQDDGLLGKVYNDNFDGKPRNGQPLVASSDRLELSGSPITGETKQTEDEEEKRKQKEEEQKRKKEESEGERRKYGQEAQGRLREDAKLQMEYVHAIIDPEDRTFDRVECPAPSATGLARYDRLLNAPWPADKTRSVRPVKYFFALDLRQCAYILPRLLGSIVEAMRFLGPENCVLSIVEGRSDDGTPEVLQALRAELEILGTEYFLEFSNIDTKEGERISRLAELRNMALEPMVRLHDRRRYDKNTTVIFLNDVAICMEEILELVYQRIHLGADMTCAMDWTGGPPSPAFYDVWISRTLRGESFFYIPDGGSWDVAWNLFWDDPETKGRYQAHLPFQVFSCWNGGVAFTAEPILKREISFRSNGPEECFQGEPTLFCKDLWHLGYGKIAVVPSVNLEYTNERSKPLKALKGYTSNLTSPEQDLRSRIEWQLEPPEQVKCMETNWKPEWRPWDEHMPML